MPLFHLAVAKVPGSSGNPKGTSCPFSPRIGWIVIVLFTGIFGWLLFIYNRQKKHVRQNPST